MPWVEHMRYGSLWLLYVLGLLFFFPSCTPSIVQQAVGPLDDIAKRLEEYGAITMSAPLLSRPDPSFAFDLNRSTTDYFTEAKNEIQGAAAAATQTAFYTALGVSAQFDPTQSAAYAEKWRQYAEDLARFNRKRELLDEAAKAKRDAAIASARQEPQPKQDELIAAAMKTYAEEVSAPAQPPTPPTANAGDVPGAAVNLAKPPTEARSRLADEGRAKAFGALLPQGFTPVLSNREAITTAAGDKAVEAMFRLLGHPGEAQRFKDKLLYFGAATVAVDPGWRTRKGFAADLSVRTSLDYVPARPEVVEALLSDPRLDGSLRQRIANDYGFAARLPEGLGPGAAPDKATIPDWFRCNGECLEDPQPPQLPRNPLVAAVSPLTETQNLDLASSQRRVTELSLALVVALRQAGAAGQAELLTQYVRSLQQDVRTRGAVGIANSYSASGGVFGYHIGPRLQGLGDPAGGSKAAEVLERQSFPILVLLGLDTNDLHPLLRWNNCSQRRDCSTRLEVFEPEIRFTQVSRWMPLSRHWYSFNDLFAPRLSETERIAWSYALNQEEVRQARGVLPGGTGRLVEQREYILKHHAFGSVVRQALPLELIAPSPALPKVPQPMAMIPERITIKRDGTGNIVPEKHRFVILGPDLATVSVERMSVVTGQARFVQDAGFAPQFISGTLLVTLEISGSDPIVLKLPIDSQRANMPGLPPDHSVVTPVVKVTTQQ